MTTGFCGSSSIFSRQPLDIDGQRVVVDEIPRHVPDAFQQLVAGQHLPRVVGQRHQQPVFQRGEKHVLPVLVHLSQRGVNLHRPKFHQGTPALSRPAQHTADREAQFPDPGRAW